MQSTGMILYILFFGIIAAGIWTGLNRKNAQNNVKIYSLKSVLFFFAGIWLIVSVIKLYLGEAESTLSESFWDIEGKTYLHYGIIFAVVSIMAPLLMRWVFSRHGYRLVQIFDSVYVIVLPVSLLLFGRIENRTYCILYAICLILGVGITFFYQGIIEYTAKADIKKSFLELLPYVCAWVVMTGLYYPNELFINNFDEFAGNYTSFFFITLFGSIAGIFLLLILFVLFVPKKIIKIAYLLIGGVCCAGYLQGMFLNGTLTAMNGIEQVWPAGTLIFNCAIWIAILFAAVIGGYRKTIIRKIYKSLCIYITLIQLVTLGWLIMTSDLKHTNAAITREGSLEVSAGNNVLVFVLDNFDSAWFEKIYNEDNSILTPLADFTYYRNGTSQFAHTNPGIPYMLTGIEWNDDIGEDYFSYAYKNGNYLEKIAERGTDVKIYTELNLMPEKFYQKLDNYKDTVSIKYNFNQTFHTMIRTSMYKMAPFLMKPLYGYYTSDIKEMTYNENIWSIDNDMLFYKDIVQNQLTVSDTYGSAFRFYHMRGPHGPFYLTEDLKYEPTGRTATMESQGKGSLKIVYEYMEQMKMLGKYDDATIIITADHGQGDILSAEKYSGHPDKTSRTIFLVKKTGEHHENMVINEAPVSQAELVPTILKAFGMEYSAYGRTFEEIPIDENRVRKYVDNYIGCKVIYSIDGHADDINNWLIESAIYY